MLKYFVQVIVFSLAFTLNAAHLSLINVEEAVALAHAIDAEEENSPAPKARLIPIFNAKKPKPKDLKLEKQLALEIIKFLEIYNKSPKTKTKCSVNEVRKLIEEKGIIYVCDSLAITFREFGDFENAYAVYQLASRYLPEKIKPYLLSFSEDKFLFDEFSQLLRDYGLSNLIPEAHKAMRESKILDHVMSFGSQLTVTRWELSEKVFNMAGRYGNFSAYDSLASMFIQAYNNEAQYRNSPTPRLIAYLKKAYKYLDQNAYDPTDPQLWLALKAKKKMQKFILWFAEHPQLINQIGSYDDIFRLYDRNIDTVRQIERCVTYGTIYSTTDLLQVLTNNGFRMVLWHHPDIPNVTQHIWVNEDGIMVRLKPGHHQFTVGFTDKNPVIFADDGSISLAYANGKKLLNVNENEILKFSSSFLIPTRNFSIWSDNTSNAQQDELMGQAHYRLQNMNIARALTYKELTCN